MSITATSILTMCFLNSILIAAICWLFRKNVVLQRLGPACGIGIMIIVIVRMFVPVEFFYTHSIYIKDVLTPFRRFFEISLVKYPVEITVGQLLLLIWEAGFVYLFIKKYGFTGNSFLVLRCCQQRRLIHFVNAFN